MKNIPLVRNNSTAKATSTVCLAGKREAVKGMMTISK